jgi:pyruvate kinase
MRRTKIVCTLGPATDQDGVLEQLIVSGMNVARFNFSHGSHEEQGKRFDEVVRLREKYDLPVATLLDTKGPEIRTGNFKDGSVVLEAGQEFFLTTEDIEGTKEGVSVTFKGLPQDVKIGSSILIDDGLIGMEVIRKTDTKVTCIVKNGGKVSNHKGINLPGTEISMDFISERDREDVLFGIEKGYDFVAASFTRTADDVVAMRKLLNENGGKDIRIIAKIENAQGVENIDGILRKADGIMVARGDMGVEIENEEVPIIQKILIKKALAAGKVVITATQMLDSMMHNPRPTRAETADVANAIYDGTSAVMLSGETAAGKYPILALKTMVKIAERTEEDIDYSSRFDKLAVQNRQDITAAISHATCTIARDLEAKAIITVTKSGFTANMISKYHPGAPIMGCSPSAKVCRQLNLSWGITPVILGEKKETFELLGGAAERIREKGLVQDGDVTVITAGVPIGQSGTTNMVKVHVIGEKY